MSKAGLLHKLPPVSKTKKNRPREMAIHEVLHSTIMLSLIPGIHRLGTAAHACHLGSAEVVTGGPLGLGGHPVRSGSVSSRVRGDSLSKVL